MSDPKYKKIGKVEVRVIEECAELIHILSKVQRFGWNNYNPYDPAKTPNWKLVLAEIKDLKAVITELENKYIIEEINQ